MCYTVYGQYIIMLCYYACGYYISICMYTKLLCVNCIWVYYITVIMTFLAYHFIFFTPIFTPFFLTPLSSLVYIDCRLTTLKLGWNSIKMASSWDIAKSLSVNQTLLYLDLSYNGLGQTTGKCECMVWCIGTVWCSMHNCVWYDRLY